MTNGQRSRTLDHL